MGLSSDSRWNGTVWIHVKQSEDLVNHINEQAGDVFPILFEGSYFVDSGS
jgi:hypothetical protein